MAKPIKTRSSSRDSQEAASTDDLVSSTPSGLPLIVNAAIEGREAESLTTAKLESLASASSKEHSLGTRANADQVNEQLLPSQPRRVWSGAGGSEVGNGSAAPIGNTVGPGAGVNSSQTFTFSSNSSREEIGTTIEHYFEDALASIQRHEAYPQRNYLGELNAMAGNIEALQDINVPFKFDDDSNLSFTEELRDWMNTSSFHDATQDQKSIQFESQPTSDTRIQQQITTISAPGTEVAPQASQAPMMTTTPPQPVVHDRARAAALHNLAMMGRLTEDGRPRPELLYRHETRPGYPSPGQLYGAEYNLDFNRPLAQGPPHFIPLGVNTIHPQPIQSAGPLLYPCGPPPSTAQITYPSPYEGPEIRGITAVNQFPPPAPAAAPTTTTPPAKTRGTKGRGRVAKPKSTTAKPRASRAKAGRGASRASGSGAGRRAAGAAEGRTARGDAAGIGGAASEAAEAANADSGGCSAPLASLVTAPIAWKTTSPANDGISSIAKDDEDDDLEPADDEFSEDYDTEWPAHQKLTVDERVRYKQLSPEYRSMFKELSHAERDKQAHFAKGKRREKDRNNLSAKRSRNRRMMNCLLTADINTGLRHQLHALREERDFWRSHADVGGYAATVAHTFVLTPFVDTTGPPNAADVEKMRKTLKKMLDSGVLVRANGDEVTDAIKICINRLPPPKPS